MLCKKIKKKKIFCMVWYNLYPWLRNIVQGHCTHFLWAKELCGWSMRQIEPREETVWSKEDFLFNSALTFFFHPETCFKVTAHLLPKALCGWSMNQIRPREERYSPDKDLRWTDWSLLVAHRTGPYNNLTVIKNLIYQISHVPWMNPQIVKCDNDEFLVILKQNLLL